MSAQKQRVVLSFLSREAMPKIESGDLTKLMNIQIELNALIDAIKPLKQYQDRNKATDSASEQRETRQEISDLENQIKAKADEYAKHMHKMYPREPLKECYPKLDY